MADPNNEHPKTLPFFQSPVFVAGLSAFGMQAFNILINAPIELLQKAFTFDRAALAQLFGLVFTGMVLWLRARSTIQPLTMGTEEPPVARCAVLAVMLAVAITLLPGCATVRENPATAQLVTQYAVGKYLQEKKTDQARYDAAVRIIKVASDLKIVTSGQEVQLLYLRTMVQGAIAGQKLSPPDKILADGLAGLLLAELEARFKTGPSGLLNPEQVVVVNDVLSWIIAVAMTIPNPALERPS